MLAPQVEAGLLSEHHSPSQVGAWVNAGVFGGGHATGDLGESWGVPPTGNMSALNSPLALILKDYSGLLDTS